MTCPYLEYRASGDGRVFDVERAFCTVTGSFVQPMRADICTDRYDLHHAEHCEIFIEHESAGPDAATPAADSEDDP